MEKGYDPLGPYPSSTNNGYSFFLRHVGLANFLLMA